MPHQCVGVRCIARWCLVARRTSGPPTEDVYLNGSVEPGPRTRRLRRIERLVSWSLKGLLEADSSVAARAIIFNRECEAAPVHRSIRHPFIREGRIEARAYQLEAADAALAASMLLVMPTAMGKTAVEWLTIAETRRRRPTARIILVAPTNALVDQHLRDLQRVLTDSAGDMVTMTGKTPPNKRDALWTSHSIIVATPQVVRNDIIRESLDLGDVALLVIDEAHHATGAHAMAQLGDLHRESMRDPLLLGATASPGSSEEQIEEVCERLGIHNIHVRRAEEPMLVDYAAGLDVEEVMVPVPEALTELAAPLQSWLEAIVDRERRLGHYIRVGRPTMGGLRQAMERVSRAIDRGERIAFRSAKEIATGIRLYNLINLLTSQGVAPARESLARMQRTGGTKEGRAVRDMLRDRRLQTLVSSLEGMHEVHSKVSFTRRIVRQELTRNPSGRIIIFANYRDTVASISDVLSDVEGARPQRFIGQSNQDNRPGMSQKEQLERLQAFRDGEVNVLIATSVGEEGLDVPSADLVLFYEPVGSEIRTIQRRGRTGRHRQGSVYVLIAQGTRDEGARAAARSREQRMQRALQRVRRRRRGRTPHDDLSSLDHFEVIDEAGVAESATDFVARERERCRPTLRQDDGEERPDRDETASDEGGNGSGDGSPAAHPAIPPERMRAHGQTGLDAFPQRDGSSIQRQERNEGLAEEVGPRDSGESGSDGGSPAPKQPVDSTTTDIGDVMQSAESVIDAFAKDGDDPGPATDVTIIADHREMSSTVVAHLRLLGARIELSTLPTGDYMIGDQTVVERKTVRDVVDSLIDGRLFDQANRLVAAAPRALMVIEGRGLYEQGRVSSNALMGALSTIAIDIGLPVFSTADGIETARFLLIAARRENSALLEISRLARERIRRSIESTGERQRAASQRPGRPSADLAAEAAVTEAADACPEALIGDGGDMLAGSEPAAAGADGDGSVDSIAVAVKRSESKHAEHHALAMLCGLPGVGRNRARDLLAAFGSIHSIAAASASELQAVRGVGPATAASIRQVLAGERR